MRPPARARPAPRHGLARVISKLGVASRTQAARWIAEGRVGVDGRVQRDPERPTDASRERITLDGEPLGARAFRYLAMNKPRGYVTTASDERGRATVYALLADADLPWLAPVGRLDKASEGLLLFTNDSAWAARITSPDTHVHKTYHVQVDGLPDASILARMQAGVEDAGDRLAVRSVRELRRGERNAWLEIVLEEGRNRHIRRLLAALGVNVLRLVRVEIGGVGLGRLEKGGWRWLDPAEVSALRA